MKLTTPTINKYIYILFIFVLMKTLIIPSFVILLNGVEPDSDLQIKQKPCEFEILSISILIFFFSIDLLQ